VLERPPQRYGQSFIRGGIRGCWFVLLYFAPCCPLPRPRRPCPRPCPRPRHDRTCLIRCNLLSFLISAATAGGRTTVQTVSAAAKTLPTTPTRERYIAARVKGYCTHRTIFTLLCCTTDELFFSCCDSVAAHFKHAATRQPQASVLALRAAGANQLLRPASTTPRNYGRRHRSWHHGHVHTTHNERRCGKRPVHHDQVHAWHLGHRHGVMGTTIKHLR
jgi:hypothetical protein